MAGGGRNPRRFLGKIVHAFNQGDTFNECRVSDLWTCCHCLVCSERCPEGIDVAHIFRMLQNSLASKGEVPPSIAGEIELLWDIGCTVERSKALLKRREALGLQPPKETNIGSLQSLITAVLGLDKVMQIMERQKGAP